MVETEHPIPRNYFIDLDPHAIPPDSRFPSFRIVNGEKIGIGMRDEEGRRVSVQDPGERITGSLYATNPSRINNIALRNDEWALINRATPFDDLQRVQVIDTQTWAIPPQEWTETSNQHWATTDTDQITIDEGEVIANLTLNQFNRMRQVLKLPQLRERFGEPTNPDYLAFIRRLCARILEDKDNTDSTAEDYFGLALAVPPNTAT